MAGTGKPQHIGSRAKSELRPFNGWRHAAAAARRWLRLAATTNGFLPCTDHRNAAAEHPRKRPRARHAGTAAAADGTDE